MCRKKCSAFHPDAKQKVLELPSTLLGLERWNPLTQDTITAIYNMTKHRQTVSMLLKGKDLITGRHLAGKIIELAPYEFKWVLK